MTGFYLASGLSALAALGLLLPQLVREPTEMRRYALAGVVVLWIASTPFGLAGNGTFRIGELDQLEARLGEHLLRIMAAYSLVLFLAAVVEEGPRWRSAVRRHAVPPLVAGLAMVAAAAAVPADLRAATAGLAVGAVSGPVGSWAAAVFYLSGNVYFVVAFGAALHRVHRRRTAADGALRRGLILIEAGLALLVTATALLIVANLVRWSGRVPPGALSATGVALMLPGLLAFLAGIVLPGVALRWALFRVWREHRRAYLELRPLWEALHAVFPETALDTPHRRDTLRERLSVDGVHRRYYRRVVECRDGLVRLSPYLPQAAQREPTRAHLQQALRSARLDGSSRSRAVVLARPEGERIVDDVARLRELAARLQPRRRGRWVRVS